MTPKVLLFMKGLPRFQQPFWEQAFVATGLERITDIGVQINALSSTLYPDEILDLYGDAGGVAARFYDWTRWRLDDDYMPPGRAYTHLLIDTEPQKRDLTGPDSSWGWKTRVEGFADHDVAVLNAMVRGAKEATDGLPIGHYRLPNFPARKVMDRDALMLETAAPIMEHADWVWQHEYEVGEVTRDNALDALDRQLTQRKALVGYGKPVYNAIWPGYRISPDEVVNRFEHVLWSSARWQDEYLIVWVDLDTPGDAITHTANMVALAPKIREVFGAGDPQGVE